jgi:tetrapyrrole methylase family protein/MazG family protein
MSIADTPDSRRALGEELKSNPGYDNLVRLIETLLGDNGCPWDRERKVEDCPEYIQGELREVIEAIESGDDSSLEEELGDLLFMVTFTCILAEKEGRLTRSGMFGRILNKMVYRHPHVFGGDMDADDPEQVLSNWQELKRNEKKSGCGGTGAEN